LEVWGILTAQIGERYLTYFAVQGAPLSRAFVTGHPSTVPFVPRLARST
jgi:hypothetical protein